MPSLILKYNFQYKNNTIGMQCPWEHHFIIDTIVFQLRRYVEEAIKQCNPSEIHLCDGSERENKIFIEKMLFDGTIVPLPKYRNW